jgi:hypothetical protein
LLYLIPFDGLEIKDLKELSIGRVTIYSKLDEIESERIKDVVEKIKSPTSILQEDDKKVLFTKPIALLEFEPANANFALEEATKIVTHSLNALIFYLSGLSELNVFTYRFHIAITGTSLSSTMFAIAVDHKNRAGYHGTRTGHSKGFELTKSSLEKMKALHFDTIHKLLRQPEVKRKTFAKNVLTAIDYFGYAINELEKKNAFLDFVIALEALLSTERSRKRILSERIAYILQTEPKKRKSLMKRVDDLYNIRSEIVHEGKDSVTKDDLVNVSRLAWILILALIPLTSTINDKTQLMALIEDQKLSAPAFQLERN